MACRLILVGVCQRLGSNGTLQRANPVLGKNVPDLLLLVLLIQPPKGFHRATSYKAEQWEGGMAAQNMSLLFLPYARVARIPWVVLRGESFLKLLKSLQDPSEHNGAEYARWPPEWQQELAKPTVVIVCKQHGYTESLLHRDIPRWFLLTPTNL
jgi:hypothetical protein